MFYNHENPTQKSIYDNKILVVDDAMLNRELITSFLKGTGYQNVATAVDGEDALHQLKQYDIDLVILDLLMPNVDGTEVIKKVRTDARLKQLPILVQTAISDPEERAEAWKYGATDIITKPIHKLELLARVKVHLENSFLIGTLENYQKIADHEVAKALELQKSLLPSEDFLKQLGEKHHISIDSIFIPSRFLSGDIWGLYELDPGRILVWICDFSGKGISASLYTLRLHTLIAEHRHKLKDPSTLIHLVNTKLFEMVNEGHFCTFLAGVVDLNRMKFDYLSASATHPIVYHPFEKSYSLGDGAGLPLGITKEVTYPLKTLDLKPGDNLILYSDLMWEDQGTIPDMSFLPEELPGLIHRLNGQSLIEMAKDKIRESAEPAFSDDLTLIEIAIKPGRS
ncbi:PP2C family protein-serine/threonine phosphatase [Candidatus Odyssella acanthamoebae]|uniref:PP2C family protein-serine/threonine phosphatase n=1 Tax=Candidatus Odyssella acanthamoebae TaxID=91604 RepID=UPI00068B4633|nr:fused response regulator/phosphatase [Candidatus Paracaedibacter acanthamoebae]